MNGLINVSASGLDVEYTPACQCGCMGDVEASIEWAELTLLGHIHRAHKEQAA